MNNGVKIAFAFIFGAAVGSAVTWKLIKTKYEDIAQEEINSVKEVYSRKWKKDVEKDVDDNKDTTNIVNNYNSILTENSYTNNVEKGGSDSMKNKDIEVIPPDEYGAYPNYENETLTYYEKDEILTDDRDNVIEDVESIVGPDALDSFGEWEDDVVYVKNNTNECYYEILRDSGSYSDLIHSVKE